MAFDYKIFPGFTAIGVVSAAVRELAVTFNLEAIKALSMPVAKDIEWADMAGVTPAVFEGKIPIDFTALDGFEEFKGVREYKQIEVAAIQAKVNPWQRNLEWPIQFDQDTGNVQLKQIYNMSNWASAMVMHARVMKARLAATVLMKGTPSVNLAQVYAGNDIPGAGKSLFNTAHLANPLDASSRTFSNYITSGVTAYDSAMMKLTRQTFRAVPSPVLGSETLGVQVTDIIGGSRMEEPFREVQIANLILKTATIGADGVAAGVSNIYAAGSTPVNYWIAPQLDADPFYVANATKHMWIAISRTLPGARAVEMVAPTREFTPRLQLFGDGSEMAATSRKVRLLGDLDAGAAAGLPHVCARFEEQ